MQICPVCNSQNSDTATACAYCGQSLTGLLATGTLLQERYSITRLLGRGGMGAVYKAHDLRLGNRPVAVKENFDTSAEAQAQFELEANILAALNHPNLPRVMDHFIEPSGKQYLVMDFVEGEDLEEILARQGHRSESQALLWVEQVCDALEYMHSQRPPIIHRAIKPANVRITPDDKAMLVDFGIAKVYRPAQQTVVAARAVTPGFSPPEQYGGARTDTRSDVYALGATLYCMVTGQVPPDAMDRVTGAPLIPPQRFNPTVSSATETAISQSMELNPTNRPQTVRELRQVLGRPPQVYSTPPAPAWPAPSVQPLPRPVPVPVPAPVPAPTPVAAPFQFASFGQRFMASLIDGFILGVVLGCMGLFAGGLAAGSTDDAAAGCLNLLILAAIFGYFTYFHAHSGQTPGKKALGIKVISADGSPVSTGRSAARAFGYMATSLLAYIFVGLLGFLWMTWDPNKQTWHDKLARTYVIKV